jgi:PAS domain-containing protein
VPFTVLVLVGYLTLAAPGQGSSPALLYSLVPFLLWSALRLGLTGTATAMIVIAAMSIWGAIHGRGPFAEPGQLDGVLSLQLFLLVTAAPFMFLAVLVEERKQAEEAAREGEERLRLAQQAAEIGTFEWNIQSGVNRWTPELEVLYGLPRGSFPGTQEAFAKMVHPDDFPRVEQWIGNRCSVARKSLNGVIWADRTVRWLAGSWRYSERTR